MNLAAQQLPSNNHFVVCGLKLALMTLAGKWVANDMGQRHRPLLDNIVPLGDRAGVTIARRGSLNPEIAWRH